jgi:KDO2-lipid IV(A) lauroyltransferase
MADSARLNLWFESEIRKNPAQYLWVHRRFKTRPPGEAPLY